MDYCNLALFSDLDGTLLDRNRQVSRENREALAHFIAGGGLFGISTGRAPMNALELLPGVPINTWSVVLNGAEAYRYQTGTVAFPRVLPQLRAQTVQELLAQPGGAGCELCGTLQTLTGALTQCVRRCLRSMCCCALRAACFSCLPRTWPTRTFSPPTSPVPLRAWKLPFAIPG